MNILIVHSTEQWGHDNVLGPFIDCLATPPSYITSKANFITLDADENEVVDLSDVVFDVVLCINAMPWYLKNRTAFKGRPWVGTISFAAHDLHEFLRNINAATDLGINAMFTNCANFVKQCSAVWPVAFTLRPSVYTAVPQKERKRRAKFGSILPNIVDRDFSQIELTIRYLKELNYKDEFALWIHEDEKRKLPEGLEEVALVGEDLTSLYGIIDYIIPAPRISDLRIGTPPSEVLEAVARGCKPLLFTNPRVNALDKYVSPHFTSLSSYKDAIKSILAGNHIIELQDVTALLPVPAVVSAQIWTAYVRWISNNATTAGLEV